MDQLQQYWAIVKKHHFWILSGLAVLLPLVLCLIAGARLAKAYTDQVGKISSTDSSLQPLTSGDHANQQWIDHVNNETAALRSNVYTAWKEMYARQQAELKWPEALGKDFIDAFTAKELPNDQDKIAVYCARFQTFVKVELAQMADMIGAQWQPTADKGTGDRTGGQAQPDSGGKKQMILVSWNPEDQQKLNKEFDWPTPPTPLAIRFAQEELWVRQEIFKAIARTNAGATGDFDAIIHRIDHSFIGYDASDKFPLSVGSNRLNHMQKNGDPGIRGAGVAGAGPGPGGTPALEPKRPTAGIIETTLGPASAAGPTDPDTYLKELRYVDDKGKPLSAADSDSTTEYRLLAFKLDLVADEQRWQKFLIELSNSPLPLEVRAVRVDPRFTAESHEMVSSSMPGGRHFDESGTGMVRNDLPIEIYGFAYILKEPDPAKLGITGGESPDAVAAPAATPAGPATPPAAPTAPRGPADKS